MDSRTYKIYMEEVNRFRGVEEESERCTPDHDSARKEYRFQHLHGLDYLRNVAAEQSREVVKIEEELQAKYSG